MKKLLGLLLLLSFAPALASEKVDLGAGRSAVFSLPETWKATDAPPRPRGMPALGTTVRYVPRSGANEAVVITLMIVPGDHLEEPAELRAVAERASRGFLRGALEEKVELRDFKVGGRAGFAARFTDARLVGQPPVPDDYKTMTCCYVYLGDRVFLTASIFSDDPDGESYTAAKKIIQSITLSLPQNTI